MAMEGVDSGLVLMKECGWSWQDLCATPNRIVVEMLALIRLQNELNKT